MPAQPPSGGVLGVASLYFRASVQAFERPRPWKFPPAPPRRIAFDTAQDATEWRLEETWDYRHTTISGIKRRRHFLNARPSICPAGRPKLERLQTQRNHEPPNTQLCKGENPKLN